MSRTSIASKIERLEAFEDNFGITIQSESAYLTDHADDEFYFEVLGEIHPTDGVHLKESICICAIIYGDDERIITKTSQYINKDDFFGFSTFMMNGFFDKTDISKIRLYPTTP